MRVRETTVDNIARSPHASSLFREYAEESGIDEMGRANPNLDSYRLLEQSGYSHLFAAEEGRLVGFCVLLIGEHPHYSEVIATIDTIFCSKEYRDSKAGSMLLIAAKRKARELGARIVLISARHGTSLHKQLAASRAAVPVQHLFEI